MEPSERAPAPPETPTASVSENAESAEKRKRQPRNSACQPCASLKMKCVSVEGSAKCERCQRMGRECTPAIPKPRKRKVEDVGYDSTYGVPMSSFLNGNATTTGPTAQTPTPTTHPRPSVEQAPAATVLTSRPDIRHNGSRSFAALFAQGLGLSELPRDLVIDCNYVNNCFTIFRQYAAHFPFVPTFLGVDAVAMVGSRPFTTAAVCTVSSPANPSAQDRLSGMFRFALSNKTLVEGDQSVDMMIGLLIYMAWHHHYLSKPQIYQNLCLLAAMATDLGLYQHTPQTTLEDVNLAIERDRAFVGIYSLSCHLSRKGLGRASPLRWTDQLRQYAENVARSSVLPTDQSLVQLLELAHILEDLEDGSFRDVDLNRSTINYTYELHAKSANSRLKTLKREHPSLSNNPAFSVAMIDVHYRLLSTSDTSDTSALIQCAVLIKEYLDDVLSRPPITLHQIAITDWTDILSVLMMLCKFSKPLPNNAGWEAGALTSMLQPTAVIDALCGQMASPAADPLTPRHELLLQRFRTFCERVKEDVVEGDASTVDRPQPHKTNGSLAGEYVGDGILNRFMHGR